MKLNKLILITAAFALACATLGAQSVRISGYVETPVTAAAQVITQSGSEAWDAHEVVAEFGPPQNGIHFLNLNANYKDVDFHAAVWLGAGVGPWYGNTIVNMYPDRINDDNGVWNEMYVVTHFLNDQMRFYSGVFAGNGFTNGYVYGSYVSGQSHVSPLAMRGSDGDTSFTGIEVSPFALAGFRAILGFPIAPFTEDYKKYDSWGTFFKSFKFMAQYKWLRPNITFNAGVRPFTYGSKTARTGGDEPESLWGEAFLQVDLPSLVQGFPMNLSYDIRWKDRTVGGWNTVSGDDWSTTALAHMAMWSMRTDSLVPGWSFSVEDLFGWYGAHYIAINEMALYNRLGVSATHGIPGTPFMFGTQAYFMYGQDANGGMMDRNDSWNSDLIGYNWNFMGELNALPQDVPGYTRPASGHSGRYMGVYVYPYIQKNFSNGRASIGVELQYARGKTANVAQNLSWRVPVGLAFWW